MATWPTSVAADAQLYVAVNELQTNLSAGIDNAVTTLGLNSTTGFPTVGLVLIDNEIIKYAGVSGATLTGCTRAFDGTTAASHSSGAIVSFAICANHHNVLKNEIEAIEQYLSDNLGTGAAPLTASRALVSDSAGKIIVAAVTSAELGYLSGVTSAIQTQLNAKVANPLGGDLAAGAHKITGLAAGSVNGDALRYEQLIGLYMLLTGGTMSGAIAMGTNKITGLGAATAAGDATRYEQVSPLWAYRRPALQYVSGTTVQVEAGIDGTASEVAILFPDGTMRKDSTALHTLLDMSRVAALSGTKQSGLRTGTKSNNTWYAAYAVKATDNTTDFVAVADTVLPLQANFVTLNSNFGANGWVYLGLIVNGDNAGATTVIPKFVMSGNKTSFFNVLADGVTNVRGVRLASTAGATSLTYTYAAGTALGSGQVPANVLIGMLSVGMASSTFIGITDAAAAKNVCIMSGSLGTGTKVMQIPDYYLPDGVVDTPSGSTAQAVDLVSFIDSALGVGSNPLL